MNAALSAEETGRQPGPFAKHQRTVIDFPTAQAEGKTVATQIAKLALAGHAVHKGKCGDFLVCKYGLSRYCQDFQELKAFARQLGVR